MGLESPKHIEQIEQKRLSRRPQRIKLSLNRATTTNSNRVTKPIASQLPLRKEKVKSSALYKLSKVDINPPRIGYTPRHISLQGFIGD